MNNGLIKLAETLKGDNWHTWKVMTVTALEARDLMGYVDGTIPMPTSAPPHIPLTGVNPPIITTANTPTVATYVSLWNGANNRAKAQIILNCEADLVMSLEGSATDVWDALVADYENTTWLSRSIAIQAFRGLRYKDGESLREHIKALRTLKARCVSAGQSVPDEEFAVTIILSLPTSWDSIIGSISATNLNSAELITRLILDEERRMSCAT